MSEAVLSRPKTDARVFSVLCAVSFCHLLNDMLQSLFAAAYPIFKGGLDLTFGQIGTLTLIYSLVASLLQPLIGIATDRRPQPYSLPFGMACSLAGLLVLAFASSYAMLLSGGALLGVGSAIFHPESSRVARMASGGAYGLAQSLFQVGGNVGSALGPLLVAFFVLPHGQASLAWFALAALAGMIVLAAISHWRARRTFVRPAVSRGPAPAENALGRRKVGGALFVLFCLTTSKYFYLASLTSYYIFYLMERFAVTESQSQIYLFVFLAAVVAGTLVGGPVGDRIGRKAVIWVSILGVLPFTLALPYVGLPGTVALSVVIGILLASAFPAIVVYAQDLVPGRVGMVSGLFFGLAFGMGGLGAAAIGVLADRTSLEFAYKVCAFLPAIGLLTVFLPTIGQAAPATR